MLEIGWGKLVLIGIVALLVIGPKELPAVLRTVGQWMTKLRRMAAEFQSQFQEAMREAELAELKKQVDEMGNKAQTYANFDPIGEVRREFETTQQQIEGAIAAPPKITTGDTASASGSATETPAGTEAVHGSAPTSRAETTDATEPAQSDREGKPA
jgi:sec-independent protein translocase protein TatB